MVMSLLCFKGDYWVVDCTSKRMDGGDRFRINYSTVWLADKLDI